MPIAKCSSGIADDTSLVVRSCSVDPEFATVDILAHVVSGWAYRQMHGQTNIFDWDWFLDESRKEADLNILQDVLISHISNRGKETYFSARWDAIARMCK